MKIGSLTEVNLRELWRHEQYDFSKWLSKEEHMSQLGEILGLTLTDIQEEVYVGTYRCDLVARDEISNQTVIIENQLEATNHDHLGKIITYASGLEATIMIWIVKEARAEHRSAIEWLNNKTEKDISFFLIELHAYRIGDSLPAPKFEIVEKPNDFLKTSRNQSRNKELSKAEAERLYFWENLVQYNNENGKPLKMRKPSTDHWSSIAMGTSQADIAICLINRESRIGLEVNFRSKELYDTLSSQSEKISLELGFDLEWKRMDTKKSSKAVHYINGLDFNNKANYPSLMQEIIEKTSCLRATFSRYIR